MTAPDVSADVRARFEAWHKETFGHLCRTFQLLEARWEGYRAAHADLSGEVRELVEAAEEVCRISDRKHDAWDRLKAVLAKFHPTQQEKP